MLNQKSICRRLLLSSEARFQLEINNTLRTIHSFIVLFLRLILGIFGTKVLMSPCEIIFYLEIIDLLLNVEKKESHPKDPPDSPAPYRKLRGCTQYTSK
jgi:hypothetical protein